VFFKLVVTAQIYINIAKITGMKKIRVQLAGLDQIYDLSSYVFS